jgi:hypothetical protein
MPRKAKGQTIRSFTESKELSSRVADRSIPTPFVRLYLGMNQSFRFVAHEFTQLCYPIRRPHHEKEVSEIAAAPFMRGKLDVCSRDAGDHRAERALKVELSRTFP